MIDCFITIRFFDILDIFLVAFLLYKLYTLIRGTSAFNIFIGIFLIYIFWLIVKSLNMQLLGTILGQVIGVGVIALIIVFQQEIRRFLLLIGSQYFSNERFSFNKLLSINIRNKSNVHVKSIVKACTNLSASKTGALIVIAKKSELSIYTKTGDIIDANTSNRLIESIFTKNTPLHDGAMIIVKDLIKAARCVLPVSENTYMPAHLGLRHRAALGLSEHTDAFIIVISEERGTISVAEEGKIMLNISQQELNSMLEKRFL
jgi:diadenylate cyclase